MSDLVSANPAKVDRKVEDRACESRVQGIHGTWG